jgi:hypothetical protein
MAYNRAYAAANRGRIREQKRQYRLANAEWVTQLKLERGCVDCGYAKHPAALHFDHRPGEEKYMNVSAMMSRGREAIAAEIAKCDVRCANCHNIITAQRRGDGEA